MHSLGFQLLFLHDLSLGGQIYDSISPHGPCLTPLWPSFIPHGFFGVQDIALRYCSRWRLGIAQGSVGECSRGRSLDGCGHFGDCGHACREVCRFCRLGYRRRLRRSNFPGTDDRRNSSNTFRPQGVLDGFEVVLLLPDHRAWSDYSRPCNSFTWWEAIMLQRNDQKNENYALLLHCSP